MIVQGDFVRNRLLVVGSFFGNNAIWTVICIEKIVFSSA
jgi:hypothetical protein